MSNGSSSSYVGACRKDIPYPSVSSESVPSLIDNLVTALYGEITKSVINRRVVWNIPCDPNNTAIVSPAFPRLAGEGLLCYIIRVFQAFISGGTEVFSPFLNWTFTGNGSTTIYSLPDATALLSAAYLVYIDGVVQAPVNYTIASGNPLTIVFSTAIPNGSQVVIVCMGSASQGTLDGVTINGATINTATINNLTATGTLALPVGSVTSTMILNGTIINEDINASAAIATSKLAPVTATGSTTARSLPDRFSDVVNVKDFGADPTGVFDSGPSFNLALSSFRSVIVPAGTYLIKTQIVIPNGGMLFGQTGFTPSGITSGGAKIKYHSDLGINPMIWCQNSTWISNLAFQGDGKGTGIAIKNKKTNTGQLSYEDMDCTIQGCTFDGWDISVDHWNRGLWFDSNVSALVTTSVNLNIDTANWIDDPANPFDLPDQGFRAIRITNNRLHANTAAVVNTGTGREYLRGLSVVGNQIDIGDNLFSGFCHTSVFTGNVLDQVGSTALDFYGDVYGLTISGNTFGGDTPSGQNYPPTLIRFRNTANNITINGNTFRNANTHGLSFEGALSQSSITGNTFYNIGIDGVATDACIRTTSTFTDITITGNSFFPVVAPFGIRGDTADSWTDVIVNNNVWDATKTLAAQYLETGTNFVQGSIVATPTALSADANNYAPSDASLWRISSTSSFNITGIESRYVLVGRNLTLINVGANPIVLLNESGASSSFNRIITGTGASITISSNKSTQLTYDFTSQRWRVIGL
jgi:hypothetical protein